MNYMLLVQLSAVPQHCTCPVHQIQDVRTFATEKNAIQVNL